MLTTEQIIGICFIVFGSFLLGYTLGKEAERRSFQEFVITNVLKDMRDIAESAKNFSELDETEQDKN